MALWDWMLAAYARPGVPETCLTLQDEFGQNTSVLLWAAWARPADAGVFETATRVAQTWDQTTLHPLRAVRRALKAPFPPVADAAREGLREDVKAAELRAERVLVETLEALSGAPADKAEAGDQGSALQALTAAVKAWGRPAPDDALAALAAGLA
ncbi:TIGR02444 family protein [Phenylobacterium sp. LjRoot225]|uniref:TIGR02444 family protein n=1 Tax=Phenylobacterium sp. LjRoot225 TaxID=3342285 RepID=UPI003ECE9A33